MMKLMMLARIASIKEIVTTSNGTKILNFSVAHDRFDGSETVTDWFNVVAFGGTAEFVARNFHKGQLIAIDGTLINNHYVDANGNKQYAEKIVANKVEFAGWNKNDLQEGQS